MKRLDVTGATITVLHNGFQNMYQGVEKDLKELMTPDTTIGWGSQDCIDMNRRAMESAIDEITFIGGQLAAAVKYIKPDKAYRDENSSMKEVRARADEFDEALRMAFELSKLQCGYKRSPLVVATKRSRIFLSMCDRFIDFF